MPKLSPAAPALVALGLSLALGGCLHERQLDERLYTHLPNKPAAVALAAQAPVLAPPEPALPLRDPNAAVTLDPASKDAPQPAPPKTDAPQPQAQPH